jgi:hypothetical protein
MPRSPAGYQSSSPELPERQIGEVCVELLVADLREPWCPAPEALTLEGDHEAVISYADPEAEHSSAFQKRTLLRASGL